MTAMDTARVALIRELLAETDWIDRTRDFATVLRSSTQTPGGLLLVGTPSEEPWHLAAHLDDEARYAGLPQLRPTLVRHAPPPGAPAHLAIGLDRLESSRRGETVVVVAPDTAPATLLERIDDARRTGATVLAIEAGDTQLRELANESLTVPEPKLTVPTAELIAPKSGMSTVLSLTGRQAAVEPDMSAGISFETVQHLVSLAVGELPTGPGRRGFRDRLARFLDFVSGPPPG